MSKSVNDLLKDGATRVHQHQQKIELWLDKLPTPVAVLKMTDDFGPSIKKGMTVLATKDKEFIIDDLQMKVDEEYIRNAYPIMTLYAYAELQPGQTSLLNIGD